MLQIFRVGTGAHSQGIEIGRDDGVVVVVGIVLVVIVDVGTSTSSSTCVASIERHNGFQNLIHHGLGLHCGRVDGRRDGLLLYLTGREASSVGQQTRQDGC